MNFIKVYVWRQVYAYCESSERVYHAVSRSDSPLLAD